MVRPVNKEVTARNKKIIKLRDEKGMSYREIADKLECNIHTVASVISKHRKETSQGD